MNNGRVETEYVPSHVLDGWQAQLPPAGFADRVVEAIQPAQPTQHSVWRSRWVVLAAVAAVALYALFARVRTHTPTGAGEVTATTRIPITLAHRGVAVAEPGTHVRWTVAESGVATITQQVGNVFYRVNGGQPFTVETAMGNVTAKGTCFRVETKMSASKAKFATGAALGAAIATTVVVTVYEGRVLFAGDNNETSREIAAGEHIVVGPVAKAAKAVPTPEPASADIPINTTQPPPDEHVTREALLARDRKQREQIAALKGQLKALAARQSDGDNVPDDGSPWFDPSQELLQRFAEECRVRMDTPPVFRNEPRTLSEDDAHTIGISENERTAIDKVFADQQRAWIGTLRQLYIEATGDTRAAESLSPGAMMDELQDKSGQLEQATIYQRIAQERAGLQEPPADLSERSPLERATRYLASLGDQIETRIADIVGGKRARSLRIHTEGWGQRMETVGCPEDRRMKRKVRR